MSEPLYLLDTNVVLALVRGRELGTYIDRKFGLCHAKQRPLVCVVTRGEMQVLARLFGWGERKRQALEDALDNLVTVDISHPAVIEAYVELDIVSQQHPDGARNMGKNDLWIGAAAKAAGATLLTIDNDFAHLNPDHLSCEIINPRSALDKGK